MRAWNNAWGQDSLLSPNWTASSTVGFDKLWLVSMSFPVEIHSEFVHRRMDCTSI